MDPNLLVLLAMAGVAAIVAAIAAIASSQTLREYGVWGALRRRFSGSHRVRRYYR